jgi:NAD(P)H-dependent FMN reductase
MDRALYIPILLGTVRKGRASENVAKFVLERLALRQGVETGLIDIRDLSLPIDDAASGAQDPGFQAAMARCDGLVIVAPEYNHSFPGLLKHVLDTCLEEYIHKAVGVCGVSAGGFGGTRVVQSLLPALRELGLVTIFWDGNFSNAQRLFDEDGRILDESYAGRLDKFLSELIWMSAVLRYGRENVPIG